MKKLVMVLALVVAAFSAKAAVVDWQVSGAAAQENYIVYLLTSVDGIASMADLKASALGSATIVKSGRSYGTGSQQAAGENVTKDATYYFAIVEGANATSFNYVEAEGLASNVYDPQAQETSPGVFKSLSAAQIAAGASKPLGGGVPEPTSGLLLLVGGAMLALRRKQK